MELLDIQEELKCQIQKLRVNFRKSPKERLTRQYVSTRLQALESKWKDFSINHFELIKQRATLCTNYFTEDVFGVVEELFMDFKTELKEIIEVNTASPQKDNSLNISSNFKSKIKLPKIVIPTFSGLYTEWVTFRDLFKSLIHNNGSIDDVQKLHYLKGHLTGEAEQLVRHIPISNTTYLQCWTLLENRYNNTQYLANCILKRFFSLKNVMSESASLIKQLLDSTNDMLNGLSNLEIDTSSWDVIVIYIVSQKLDPESRKLWEARVSEGSSTVPTLNAFKDFLEHRFRSLEFLDCKPIKQTNTRSYKVQVTESCCSYCSESHKLYNCKNFVKLGAEARRDFVRSSALCFNCLGDKHSAYSCRQSARCRICNKRHHSLLHPVNKPISSDQGNQADTSVGQDRVEDATTSSHSEINNVVSCFSHIRSQALLATALVKVETQTGSAVVLRALLDQGSQASFITESTVQLLGLKKMPIEANISRLGDDGGMPCTSIVSVKVKSRLDPTFIIEVKAYVVKKLTSLLPEKRLPNLFSTLPAMELADPCFGTPNKIEMILSVGVYSQILLEGLIKGPPGSPVAQKTRLGWILSGDIYDPNGHSPGMCNNVISNFHVLLCENDTLKKSGESEGPVSIDEEHLIEEKEKCGKLLLFYEHTKKGKDVLCLQQHTGVPNDTFTTEVRTVFDESCQRTSSLNHELMVGSTLRPELRQTITRWRCHPICLPADIMKIKVADEDVDFQHLFWRDNSRVTFGITSPPYLTVRCLLAGDKEKIYPFVSNRIMTRFFLNDLTTGFEYFKEGMRIYAERDKLLSHSGFQLQKSKKDAKCFKKIPHEDESKIELKIDTVKKILRIAINRERNKIKYTVQLPPLSTPVTKRKVILDLSRLFDPLGQYSPEIMKAKIQKFWLRVHQNKWKKYISNRISEILITLESSQSFHVDSRKNPADRASRGIIPVDCLDDDLWIKRMKKLKCYVMNNSKDKIEKTNLNVKSLKGKGKIKKKR